LTVGYPFELTTRTPGLIDSGEREHDFDIRGQKSGTP
jgi:hypothetical protein